MTAAASRRTPVLRATSHASGRVDLPRFTAMRGLGAVIIVVGHFLLTLSLPTKAQNDFAIDLLQTFAVAGLSCFFTLSGFVLTWVTPPGFSARKFWRGRFARLYPTHVVTWALAFAVLIAVGKAFVLWKMIPSLFLVNIWVPDLDVFWGPNTPSWTLGAEAFFYLLFPVLLAGAWKLPVKALYPAVGVVLLLAAGWATTVGLLVPREHMITDGTPLSQYQYFAIVSFAPARLLDFALGILLARIVIARQVPSGLRPWLYISLFGGYAVARWVIPQPLGFVCAMLPAVVVGLLYSARADLEGRGSLWLTPTMHWLGDRSFPLYLVHWPILWGSYRALGNPTLSIPVAAVYCLGVVLASCAAADVIHRTIEIPAYRRLARSKRVRPRDLSPGFAVSSGASSCPVADVRYQVGGRQTPQAAATQPDEGRPTPSEPTDNLPIG